MIDHVDNETTPLEMANLLQEFTEKISSEKDLHPSDYLEKDIQLLYTIAHKHYSIDNYAEAETFFMRLVLARPSEVLYWRGLASSRQMQKKYADALVAWGMCATVDATDLSCHLYGAECLINLEEIDQAKKALEHVESTITNDHPIFEKFQKIKNQLNQEV